jgi:gas vesicle protein
MSSKTQPEEEHVLSEIQKVLDQNPDFGVKRVSTVLKEQNPDWTISEKRVTKLLKKHKSTRITFDANDSDSTSEDSSSPKESAAPSPWNVAPTATPAHDPWNTSPVVNTTTSVFNTVTETTSKIVSAFNLEPVAEPEAAVHNPWNTAPVHDKTFTETVKENVSKAVETVKDKAEDVKDAASDAVEATPGFFEKVKQAAADAVEDIKDTASDVADKVSDTASDVAEKVKDATSSAPSPWNVSSVEDKSFSTSVSDSVKGAAASVAATATAGVAAVKEAVSDAKEAGQSAWNAAPVEETTFVTEPVKELVTPVVVVPVVEEPKKEAWNFTPVKEEAEKVAEALKEGVKKGESFAESAADKIKEETAAAVVVLKKAESAVEDKLREAKVAAENFVGYENASVAPKKDKSARGFPEKEKEASACGICTCSVQ